jgi:microcystin degradation protein MlrC
LQVFIASIATETNTFSPIPTGQGAWDENGITKNASLASKGYRSVQLSVFRQRAEEAGYHVVESIRAFAQPAGATARKVYEALRDTLLNDLKAAASVDMVLLALHGAMVADGYDDCEGDIITRVREIAPYAVIGVELDLHCHLTPTMVGGADLIIIFKEYPHIDLSERAEELFNLCHRKAQGEIRPVAAMVDTHMIGSYPTFRPPMKSVVDELRAAEKRSGVLSASIAHGFPWGDVTDVGTRVLVYADDDKNLATEEAMAIAESLYEQRHVLLPAYLGVDESLDRARGLNGRVVLGDYSDNAGGGAPSDSTFFLRSMMKRDLENAVIGAFHDPAVAKICADSGVGAQVKVRLGGKCGPVSGDPIDLEAEVMAVKTEHDQDIFGVFRSKMGLTIWLRHKGIDIVVNSIRQQVYGLDCFTGLGIDLMDKRLIVVKSSVHYEAAYGPIADSLWPVISPGTMNVDFGNLRYTRRDPDYFPRIDDPWAVKGKPEPQVFWANRK